MVGDVLPLYDLVSHVYCAVVLKAILALDVSQVSSQNHRILHSYVKMPTFCIIRAAFQEKKYCNTWLAVCHKKLLTIK